MSQTGASALYRPGTRELFVRAWAEDVYGTLLAPVLLLVSEADLYDEAGELLAQGVAAADPAGVEFLDFTFQVALAMSRSYRMRVRLEWSGGSAERDFGFSVTR
jgi:hypothetical protein